MNTPTRSLDGPVLEIAAGVRPVDDAERLLEWIVTNGLGGYASGTVGGVATRRYHGLLIAALPAPLGRTMTLAQVNEQIVMPDRSVAPVGPEALAGRPGTTSVARLAEFRLEAGLPVWRYEVDGVTFEKRLVLSHMQNTVYLSYRLLSSNRGEGPVHLTLRPLVHFRGHDAPVDANNAGPYRLTAFDERYEVSDDANHFPPLRLTLFGEGRAFTLDTVKSAEVRYSLEAQRGYESTGELWSPGVFRVGLKADQPTTLVASTEPWETLLALSPDEADRFERGRRTRLLIAARSQIPTLADTGIEAELVLAADQFLITPAGRVEDATRARAIGEEVRTVIAGYHWFTDWGRDTMITLEGLTLTTGRHALARYILYTFAYYIRDGLIPNMFPEGQKKGLYHTADATLWFFHALDRYIALSGDTSILTPVLPRLIDIADHHVKGTRFGIGVDPADGLLTQGEEGYQLTWMDAKVGDWVVTPRRGKAVEINALWYNALKLLERWVREAKGDEAAKLYTDLADRTHQSFNARFWNDKTGHLYDVVDGAKGDDPACRPNQLFAVSLPNPVLDPARWSAVVETARERLLTPVGLRSLAPGSPDYKSRYFGDLRDRDAAYHQGTVWAWLIGPFIDAWLKVHPDDRAGARSFLKGFGPHLAEGAIGTISEVFDAEPPYTPRGCIAQAWSVAEVLRCWAKTGDQADH